MNSVSQDLRGTLLNKVPEITIFFWIIKVLCTTMGETAADFLNVNLNFGLTGTSIVTGALLFFTLYFQFKAKQYVPGVYWSAVVLISVFGTLVTDNLTDSMGVPLEVSTIFFSIALLATFGIWYAKEKTLAMHSIVTKQREVFYWLAILFTFALGTAAGDLMAEGLGLGYAVTGMIVCGVIVMFSGAWRLGLNPVLAFWIIYIMTRPLGASLGDYLSQPEKYGGLGLGATTTSVIFLVAILATVTYLSVTKRDVVTDVIVKKDVMHDSHTFLQVWVTIGVLVFVAGGGYFWQQSLLQKAETPIATESEIVATPREGESKLVDTEVEGSKQGNIPLEVNPKTQTVKENTPTTAITQKKDITKPVPKYSSLGDLSNFRTITQDTLNFVHAGKFTDAKDRIGDLEYEWDNAEAKLKRMDSAKWSEVDDAIDASLRQVRAVSPDPQKCETALNALLIALQ